MIATTAEGTRKELWPRFELPRTAERQLLAVDSTDGRNTLPWRVQLVDWPLLGGSRRSGPKQTDSVCMIGCEPIHLAKSYPGRFALRVCEQALDTVVTRVAGLLVAAERLCHIPFVEAVDPDYARIDILD